LKYAGIVGATNKHSADRPRDSACGINQDGIRIARRRTKVFYWRTPNPDPVDAHTVAVVANK
jgi:hypothetical protein